MACTGLIELAVIHGVFDEVLDYLGKGCELCLSLCSKQILALVSESFYSAEGAAQSTVTYVADQISKAGAMTIKVLRGRLKRLHWPVSGTTPRAPPPPRCSALCLPSHSSDTAPGELSTQVPKTCSLFET